MNFLDVFLLSISMSLDACSVNIVNGVSENIKKRKLIICALLFGIFQFLMPLAGYLIGYSFKDQISKYVPYIAFILLTFLSIKSLVEFIKEIKKKDKDEEVVKDLSFGKMLGEAVATSIDALSIGFIYIDQSLENALIIFTIIGAITFILSSIAGLLSKLCLSRFEKYSSLIAAIVFFLVGLKILLEGIL